MAMIAFIGLGAMGRHMAASLQRAGHELRVHDARRETAEADLAAGAAWAGDRSGQHSIRINDQWRLCFVWTAAGPERVEIVDYH